MSVSCSTSVQPKVLRLATTTSTRDSGLLDVLLPPFEEANHVRVDVIAAGTGKALKLGEMGDVDVVFAHAREAEEAFMAAGHGVRREDVMYNTFELLGPQGDPAGIRSMDAVAALQEIANTGATFVSRGDDSGTHQRELQLWQAGGAKPDWTGYRETGQGMGASLVIADQLSAYILADRGTFLKFQDKVNLQPLAAQSSALRNPYGILVVNPDKHPSVCGDLANALVNYIISPAAQQRIANYRVADQQLFFSLHPYEE